MRGFFLHQTSTTSHIPMTYLLLPFGSHWKHNSLALLGRAIFLPVLPWLLLLSPKCPLGLCTNHSCFPSLVNAIGFTFKIYPANIPPVSMAIPCLTCHYLSQELEQTPPHWPLHAVVVVSFFIFIYSFLLLHQVSVTTRGLSSPSECEMLVPSSPALAGQFLTTAPPGKTLAPSLPLYSPHSSQSKLLF